MWQGSPMRSRARLRAQFGAPSVDKALGALPVIADFCRRLDLAGIIDRACPVREVALVTHGQVIEALVANRLTSPTPLVHVQDWASQWAVEEVWGSTRRCSTMIVSAVGWTRSRRSWSRSWDRSAPARSPCSGWM
jgi:hypothetical protein